MPNPPPRFNWVGALISLALVAAFIAYIFLGTMGPWQVQENKFNAVFPQLLGLVMLVVGYWIGTTRQSERQTELLSQAPVVPPPPPGTVVTTTTAPAATVNPAAPDADRLAALVKQLDTTPAGPDADKLAADIEALRAKIAAPKS